ncbi:Predicted dehydrogenase [Tessaracoccus bendigoensis DSM 12906]|uniref:Predicted dehydrogenase n=1 Tax=Tessaracoccus bendigoensis DSM 12906 TaxID=1123357 RepID=A0A1M6MWM3_9ACTN|nr:Gfo/Idh/MocA family oxidoreductase [Tessaracoccus bendigoensis]SHJ87834.1 Predicted dehydrogenase [Tessaracoccus bendigoensis DSM 12906]
MTRYATIGTSSIVDLFLEAGRQVEGFEHTVAHSRDSARGEAFVARHSAARVETSLDALAVADDVDVVYIASPNALHHDQAVSMLAGGKHVLVEKAAASNAVEFGDMLRVAEEHGVVIVESVRSLFDPSYAAIEGLLPALGPVRRVTFGYCQRSRRYDRILARQQVNIFDPEMSAGGLMDIGTYCVNPLVRLFGEPDAVQAAGFLLPNGIDAAGTLLCTYSDKVAEVLYSKATNSDAPSEIQGENATLVIDVIHNPRHLRLLHADHHSQDVHIDKPLSQQAYVLQAMDQFLTDPSQAHPFNRASLTALRVMDRARSQMGIHFPADGLRPPR